MRAQPGFIGTGGITPRRTLEELEFTFSNYLADLSALRRRGGSRGALAPPPGQRRGPGHPGICGGSQAGWPAPDRPRAALQVMGRSPLGLPGSFLIGSVRHGDFPKRKLPTRLS